MQCHKCGGEMIVDSCTSTMYCENAVNDLPDYMECDAAAVYCNFGQTDHVLKTCDCNKDNCPICVWDANICEYCGKAEGDLAEGCK